MRGLVGGEEDQGASGVSSRLEALGVAGGLGAQPHWAPVQGPSISTGSPWGVTYLTKAKQMTEMSSAACYIHSALHLVMACTFTSMPPNHIFLHTMYRNVIQTMFSPDQFSHIITPSI